MIFSKWARAISKILFILGSYNFLAYLECVRSYAWSKGHSDPDLGSVTCTTLNVMVKKSSFQNYFLIFKHTLYYGFPLPLGVKQTQYIVSKQTIEAMMRQHKGQKIDKKQTFTVIFITFNYTQMTSGVPLSDTGLCKIATKDKNLPLNWKGVGFSSMQQRGQKLENDKDIFCALIFF